MEDLFHSCSIYYRFQIVTYLSGTHIFAQYARKIYENDAKNRLIAL